MPVWLVTGGSGFSGRHVLDRLSQQGEPLHVVALGRRCPPNWPIDRFCQGDLNDVTSLTATLTRIAPDVVIHTAGLTPPTPGPLLYQTNTGGTFRLLQALGSLGRTVRVVLTGSAAELGPVPEIHLPVPESHPCRPVDAYGLSKWAATRLGLSAPPPLEISMARVFNPVGPGLPTSQALGRFAAKLAEPGPDPLRLVVGDLDPKRDFIDIRDVARALIALAVQGQPGSIYHIGTGQSHAVGEGLERLIRLSGRKVSVETTSQPLGRRGPADSRADIRRIVERTGWTPTLSWEQSLADLWNDTRTRRLEVEGKPVRHVA